jgi:transposase
VKAHFRAHPDAETYLSMPGIGEFTGTRVLAEFGDDPTRCGSARPARTSRHQPDHPRVRQTKVVAARFVRNNRLADALHAQAMNALTTSPGARDYYDQQRAREIGHNPALRQLANRLVGILHGCLKTHTVYDETGGADHHYRVVPPHPVPRRLRPNGMGAHRP